MYVRKIKEESEEIC